MTVQKRRTGTTAEKKVKEYLQTGLDAYKELREAERCYLGRVWKNGEFVKYSDSDDGYDEYQEEYQELLNLTPEILMTGYFDDCVDILDRCGERVGESRKEFDRLMHSRDEEWILFLESGIGTKWEDLVDACMGYGMEMTRLEDVFVRVYEWMQELR